MSPEVRRTDPPYAQITSAIRADITSGKLAEGDTIPSARQIAASWGVALATATRVLRSLREEGLVRAVPGIGTIVSAANGGFGGRDRFAATRESGFVYASNERAEVLSAALVEAPRAVAEALGMEPGVRVVRRERIVRRGSEVVSSSVSWLPGDLAERAPRLLDTERIREGTFAYVQNAIGVIIDHGREHSAAAAATEEQAASLGVELGSPVLVARVWFYGSDDEVIEYGESTRAPGLWSTYEFRMK